MASASPSVAQSKSISVLPIVCNDRGNMSFLRPYSGLHLADSNRIQLAELVATFWMEVLDKNELESRQTKRYIDNLNKTDR